MRAIVPALLGCAAFLFMLVTLPVVEAQETGRESPEVPGTTGDGAEAGAATPGAASPPTGESTGPQSRTVYRSNALAMELEVVPSGRVPAEGFALVVERTAAPTGRSDTTNGRVIATIVERRLYRDGEAIERVVVERDGAGRAVRERRFEDGTLRREEEFLPTGLIDVAREYGDGGDLEREIRYEYVERALVRREVLGGGPSAPDQLETRYVDSLSYYPSGGIRELEREWADGRRRTVRYSVVNGDVLQERFETDGEGRLVRYDERQRAVYEREWRGSTVLREARHTYQADSQTPTRTEEVLPPENRRILENFDDQGRLLRERVYENERLVREEENTYGPEGRTETVVTTRGMVERRTFAYEDDRLVEERVYRNGTLSRSITYSDERSWVERRYRNGEVFARIYYRDDAAVREEILRDGRVVESRELR